MYVPVETRESAQRTTPSPKEMAMMVVPVDSSLGFRWRVSADLPA